MYLYYIHPQLLHTHLPPLASFSSFLFVFIMHLLQLHCTYSRGCGVFQWNKVGLPGATHT